MANNIKEPILVDYCKEAMEMQISKLSPKEIDIVIHEIAKVLYDRSLNFDIVLNKVDDKTRQLVKFKVPVISFLRTDIIKTGLLKLGVEEEKILSYMRDNDPSLKNKKIENNLPANLEEVKLFIYNCLKEKYGDALVSKKYDRDIIINTKTNIRGTNDVVVKLNYNN